MRRSTQAWGPLAGLVAIVVVTACWWALALWPIEPASRAWLLRTREVCFGVAPGGLPNAGGWLLLIGQPAGMLAVLVAVWPGELRASLSRLTGNLAGQLTVGIVAGAVTIGLAGVVVRVARASGEPFAAVQPDGVVSAQLVRLSDSPPEMALTDQRGETVTLDTLRGRPVIVTFAYAHCETVCPIIVNEVLAARSQVAELRPAVLVVTLDPWRDTPSRLASIAAAWKMEGDARVLSGPPDQVEHVLNAWRVPRVRNERNGDLSHPSMVYVIGPDGKITYAVGAESATIAAAVRAL